VLGVESNVTTITARTGRGL